MGAVGDWLREHAVPSHQLEPMVQTQTVVSKIVLVLESMHSMSLASSKRTCVSVA